MQYIVSLNYENKVDYTYTHNDNPPPLSYSLDIIPCKKALYKRPFTRPRRIL